MWFDTLCDRQWYTMMTCLLHKVNCPTDPNSGKGMRRNLPNITHPEFQTMCWPILFLKYVASNLMLEVSTFWPNVTHNHTPNIQTHSSHVQRGAMTLKTSQNQVLTVRHWPRTTQAANITWTLEPPKNTPSQSKPNPYWFFYPTWYYMVLMQIPISWKIHHYPTHL